MPRLGLTHRAESEVVAVLLQHPCGVRLLLRRTAAPLAALREYPLFGLTVASYTELQHWVEPLTTYDVEHSAVHQAHRGWAVTVTGPDLVRIQLQTDEGPAAKTSRRSPWPMSRRRQAAPRMIEHAPARYDQTTDKPPHNLSLIINDAHPDFT